MSKYTMEMRYVYQSYEAFKADMTADTYQLTNEEHREPLNQFIYKHFMFREIGLETTGLFKIFLRRKMSEIMVLYDQRFNSVDLKINPLFNVDMTETFTHNISGTGKITNSGSITGKLDQTTSDTGKITDSGTTSGKLDQTNTGTGKTTNTGEQDTTGKVVGALSDTAKTDSTTTNTNHDTETFTKKDDNVHVESDTPQTGISNDDIKNNTYASHTVHDNISEDTGSTHDKDDKSVVSSTTTDTQSTQQDTTGKITNTNEEDITKSEVIGNTTSGTSTNERNATNNGTISNTSSGTNANEQNSQDSKTETFTRQNIGSSANYTTSQHIEQWRKIFLNVYMEICDELEPLFMQIW